MEITKILKFITSHPVNRDKKIKSVIRFAKWQIGSRLIPGSVVVDWINGSKFFARTGETGLTGNIYTGLHEFTDMAYLLHALRPEDTFVDVGANVGSYSILACSAAGANGIAFEPVPTTFNKLVDNMRVNHIEDRVECINEGVGSEQGELRFTSENNCMNHVLTDGEICSDSIKVNVTTLDYRLSNIQPSIIKIDVEGYETSVIDGAVKILKDSGLHSVIMELNGSGTRYGCDEQKIIDKMKKYGFGTYAYDPFSRSLTNLEGKSLSSGNTLFIRKRDFVESRLRTARKFDILGKMI